MEKRSKKDRPIMIGGKNDRELYETIDSACSTIGFSPRYAIEQLIQGAHAKVAALVRDSSRYLLTNNDAALLDKIITGAKMSIDPDRWVANVARLSESFIAQQAADDLYDISRFHNDDEVAAEIVAKLAYLIDRQQERLQAFYAYSEAAAQYNQSHHVHGKPPPPPIIPAAHILPPSEAFPIKRLQPIRGMKVPAPVWKP